MLKKYTKDEIQKKVKKSLKVLFKKDRYLLENNVNERSISHKLAIYLQEEFKYWDVDCEYNRDNSNSKKVKIVTEKLLKETDPTTKINSEDIKTVYPDIIIHRRGTDRNLLVIEMKKSTSQEDNTFDMKKLHAYLEYLEYEFAIFFSVNTKSKDINESSFYDQFQIIQNAKKM